MGLDGCGAIKGCSGSPKVKFWCRCEQNGIDRRWGIEFFEIFKILYVFESFLNFRNSSIF